MLGLVVWNELHQQKLVLNLIDCMTVQIDVAAR